MMVYGLKNSLRSLSGTMDKTEILILEVAKNPVLFNKAEKAYKETV